MRAGKLRHKLTLLAPLDSTDTLGDSNPAFIMVAQLQGAIEPLAGRELWYAQQTRADLTHKITIRGRAGLSARMRVTWQGRSFELGPPISAEERGVDAVFTAVELHL